MEENIAHGHGMAYNAVVWHECRRFAVEFLKEAKERLGGPAAPFDEAIASYEAVAERLKKVVERFPFHGLKSEHIQDEGRRAEAAEALRAAREAEAAGLAALAKIRDEL